MLHWILQFSLHQSSVWLPCAAGKLLGCGANEGNDTVHPTRSSRRNAADTVAFTNFAQLNTRRLWTTDSSIHHAGVGPGSNPGAVRRWFARGVALALDRAWSHRLIGGLSALDSVRFDVSSSCISLNHAIYGPGINPADARWWGLARHGHDPCPGGRTSRHRGDPLDCRFCGSSLGTLAHCMGSCPAFVDLQLEWCAAAGVHMRDIVQWSSHEWVFDPLHSLNKRACHIRGSRLCPR